jgi:hypothetical protein
LRGVRATARACMVLLTIMCAVIRVFMLSAIQPLFISRGHRRVFSSWFFWKRGSCAIRSIRTWDEDAEC